MNTTQERRPTRGSGAERTAGQDVTAIVDTVGDVAASIAGAPCGRRRMWLIVVHHCPHCGAMHSHRAADAGRLFAGRAVRSCPVKGSDYTLAVRGWTAQ